MADFDVEIWGLIEHPTWTVRVSGAPTAAAAGECAIASRGGRVGRIDPAGDEPAPMDRIAYGQHLEEAEPAAATKPPRQSLMRRAWRPKPWGERTITEPDVQAIRGAVTRGVVVGVTIVTLLDGAIVALILALIRAG